MKATLKLSDDQRNVTVRVPISIRKRGGRKLVLAPDGSSHMAGPVHRRVDCTMIKAIARAFRWRGMLESGEHSSVRDIGRTEKINESYVSRLLRLTLLSPDIVQAILDGRHNPDSLTLHRLTRPFPAAWAEQETSLYRRASRQSGLWNDAGSNAAACRPRRGASPHHFEIVRLRGVLA